MSAMFFFVDLVNLLEHCKSFVKDFAGKKKALSWDTRAERFENSLAEHRENLVEALMIPENSVSGFYSFCNVNPVSIVCNNCGRNSKLCSDCDDAVHSVSPLHDRHGLVDGELKHLTPIQSVSCASEISDNGELGDSNLDMY